VTTAKILLVLTMLVAQRAFSGELKPSDQRYFLNQLAPVIVSGEPGAAPPLPVSWYVEHCQLRSYAHADKYFSRQQDGYKERVSDTGAEQLNTAKVLDRLRERRKTGVDEHYRLNFKEARFRTGDDPKDRMTWEVLRHRTVAASMSEDIFVDTGVYGRACLISNKTIFVQYFLLFGWNETDTPPTTDVGNHEGDWICISFAADISDVRQPRIISAIFHNHGRQIFAERKALKFRDGEHPLVFLERGTNEPWPFAGKWGYVEGTVPDGITVNEVFKAKKVGDWSFGGEKDDWSVVREHEGKGPELIIKHVTVLEPRVHVDTDKVVDFIRDFDGWYGDDWHPGFTVNTPAAKKTWGFIPRPGLRSHYVTVLSDASCPSGPLHQPKMSKLFAPGCH
jgi:hypothetical protein